MSIDSESCRTVAHQLADEIADALIGEWGAHAHVTAIGIACRVRFEPTEDDPSDSGQTIVSFNVAGESPRTADDAERSYSVQLFETAAEVAGTPPVNPLDVPPDL